MSGKKRQELPKKGAGPGTLFVVGTPIGNLEDFTPRGRRILAEVDAILCEDTRVTATLLQACGIVYGAEKPLERADHHATPARLASFVARLQAGENLALVSDAGMPAISDPGSELVAAADAAQIEVVVVPGPSALPAFLAGAGFRSGTAVFRGFFPRKGGDRDREATRASGMDVGSVWVWFESPERVEEMLDWLAERFPDARAVAAKELTKVYERFYRGTLRDLASHIQSAARAGEVRGEWVVGVEFEPAAEASPERDAWEKALRALLGCGVSASRAAKELSHVFGISRKEIYPVAVEMAKALGIREDSDGNSTLVSKE